MNRIWTPAEISATYHHTGPENLVELTGAYFPDNACVEQGLNPDDWRIMWEALHMSMCDMYAQVLNRHRVDQKSYNLLPGYHWTNGYSPHGQMLRIPYFGQRGWPLNWPITTTIVMEDVRCDPRKILMMVMRLQRLQQWLREGGKSPDLNIPVTHDRPLAVELLSVPVTAKWLAE